MRVVIVLDVSPSMACESRCGTLPKFSYARKLLGAAALATFAFSELTLASRNSR